MAIRRIQHHSGRTFVVGARAVPTLHHSKFLKFGDLLAKGSLPQITVPALPWDFSNAASMPGLRSIYLNDQLGDCVVASMAHTLNVQAAQSGNPVTIYSDPQIQAQYTIGSGGVYVPGNPNTDQGCDEATALNAWGTNAWADGSEVKGWVSVDAKNDQESEQAFFAAKSLIYCVGLPDAWIANNMANVADGAIWDVVPGGPDENNGHSFMAFGRNADGSDKIDTWALFLTATAVARQQYATPGAGGGLYIAITTALINTLKGLSPDGWNESQLLADLAAWKAENG